MIRAVGLAFAFLCLGASAGTFSCPGCDETADSLRKDLRQVGLRLLNLEGGSKSAPREIAPLWFMEPPLENGAPKSPFFQRLEVYDNWKSSLGRLEAIEQDLQNLEAEVAAEKAAGRKDADLARLSRLARTQRLVVLELKAQLDQIYRKYEELGQRMDAQEQRIDAIQGGLDQVSAEFKNAASRMKSHLVASAPASYESIFEAQKIFTKDLNLGDIWVFPRTELSYEDSAVTTTQITLSAEGNLFNLVKADAKGGIVFDVRYPIQASILSPGMETLLSPKGAATRDAAIFCGVSKTATLRGYGSAGASGGLDLKVVKFNAGANVEIGQTFAVGARRYSPLMQFHQGETFLSKIAACHRFMKKVRDSDVMAQEVAAMIQISPIPESPCYKDYDCREEVKAGLLRPSVVSNCVPTANRERAICAHRYADTDAASCSIPGEKIYNFRYYCAKGLSCERKTRKCLPEKTETQWLKEVGLAEARAMGVSASYEEVRPTASANGTEFCEARGLKGWKLPSSEQLKATAQWYRTWGRAQMRKRSPRAAQAWYYAPEFFTHMVWSDGPTVYLLSNDSATQYDPNDPQNAILFRDPKTGDTITKGLAICVRETAKVGPEP